MRLNGAQTLRADNLSQIMQIRERQRANDADTRRKHKLSDLRLAENTVIHERTDYQITVRNTEHAVIRAQLCNIAGGHQPRAFRSQLTHADRSCIAEIDQRRRIAHKHCSSEILVKFFRQEHIA